MLQSWCPGRNYTSGPYREPRHNPTERRRISSCPLSPIAREELSWCLLPCDSGTLRTSTTTHYGDIRCLHQGLGCKMEQQTCSRNVGPPTCGPAYLPTQDASHTAGFQGIGAHPQRKICRMARGQQVCGSISSEGGGNQAMVTVPDSPFWTDGTLPYVPHT